MTDNWPLRLTSLTDEIRNLENIIQVLESSCRLSSLVEIYESRSTATPINVLAKVYQEISSMPAEIHVVWENIYKKNIKDTILNIRTVLETSFMSQLDDFLGQCQWISATPGEKLVFSAPDAAILSMVNDFLNPEQTRVGLSRICEKLLNEFEKSMKVFGLEDDYVKYILNILDIYGKILAALLSPTLHSFKKDYMSMLLQYLFAPLLNYFLHKCENFYSLFIFTNLNCKPSELSHRIQENRATVLLPSLDIVCNELSKICHQYRCLFVVFKYYSFDESRLLGTSDFGMVLYDNYAKVEALYIEVSFLKATEIKETVETRNFSYFSAVDDFCFLLGKISKRTAFALPFGQWKLFMINLVISFLPNYLHFYLNPKDDGDDFRLFYNSVSLFLTYLKGQFRDSIVKSASSLPGCGKTDDLLKILGDFIRQYERSLYMKLANWLSSAGHSHWLDGLPELFSQDYSYYAATDDLLDSAKQSSKAFSLDVVSWLDESIHSLSAGWTKEIFGLLSQTLLEYLIRFWEKTLRQQRFSSNGSYLLFEEVRAIKSHLMESYMATYHSFLHVSILRLSTIAKILLQEKAQNLQDLASDLAVSGLSHNDAVSIFALKVD